MPLAAALAAGLFPGAAQAVPESLQALVIIVNFADAPAPPDLRFLDGTLQTVPLDAANTEAVLFTNPASMSARYVEMSQGDLTVTGQVVEVALPDNIGDLTVDQWRSAADAEATTLGYTLSNFDRIGYLLRWGFNGQISVGGASAANDWFWVSSVTPVVPHLDERVINHEFGHTLGFKHASRMEANGSISEFLDQTDFMGNADAVHTNAVNKHKKGWLTGSRLVNHPLDAYGGYLLRPLADPQDDSQVLLIDGHGAHPVLGVPFDSYLSFRSPIGFDANLPAASDAYGTPLLNTLHLHHNRKDDKLFRYLDRALAAGDLFEINGTFVGVASITATGAQVQVLQSPYFPAPPLVSVTSLLAQPVVAGTPVDYEIGVTNLDTGVTFPAYYENDFVSPAAGWMISWDVVPKPILVAPNQTEPITGFRVISPLGTPPGVYDIDLTLTNETGSAGPVATLATVQYEVSSNGDVTPPPPPSGLFGNTYPGTGNDYIVLQWSHPPDISDVVLYQPYRNGVALPPPATLSTLYVDFFYSGLESNAYVVRAVDAAGNESIPSNAISVGVPDVSAPTAPTGLMGGGGMGAAVELSWAPSVDDVWVYAYEVHLNGAWLATVYDPEFSDPLPPAGVAAYTIHAIDAAGNLSPASASWEVGAALPALAHPGLLAAPLFCLAWLALRRSSRSPRTETDFPI